MTLRKRTDYLVIHVTATPPKADIGAKEVDAMHRARGFKSIGYHYVIRRNGKVEPGRMQDEVGAHVEGFNSISLGVSLVGGVDASGKPENNMTTAQFAALEMLLSELSRKYPDAKVCGHRDLSPDKDRDGIIEPAEHIKACPCFDAIPWARARGLPAASIRGAWSAPAANDNPPPEAPDSREIYLQKLLARAGYQFGAIDGLIGSRTKGAIRLFQQFAGLTVTGEFDLATVSRLRSQFETAAAA